MSEKKKYTIVVKGKRVEVSEFVYYAYHKEREAERYQKKLIHQYELSLERFQDDGVNVEFLITRFQPSIDDMLIEQEQLRKLHIALDALTVEKRLLIHELFSMEKVSEYWIQKLEYQTRSKMQKFKEVKEPD